MRLITPLGMRQAPFASSDAKSPARPRVVVSTIASLFSATKKPVVIKTISRVTSLAISSLGIQPVFPLQMSCHSTRTRRSPGVLGLRVRLTLLAKCQLQSFHLSLEVSNVHGGIGNAVPVFHLDLRLEIIDGGL